MFYLQPELLQIPGVYQVLEHARTHTDIRFSVMTTLDKFVDSTRTIQVNLINTVQKITKLHSLPLPPSYLEVSVAFKSICDNDSSDESMQSYLSACTNIYNNAHQ